MNESYIVQVLRDRQGKKVGHLVGTNKGVGWSKVHRTMDTFDAQRGLDIALGRASRGYGFVRGDGVPGISETVAVNADGYERIHTLVAEALPDFFARYFRFFGCLPPQAKVA